MQDASRTEGLFDQSAAPSGSMTIPSEWGEAILGSVRRDLALAYATELDREFLFGDGSPQAPIPLAPLSARLRWRRRLARLGMRKRYWTLCWRYRDAPLARRIVPWLMDEAEARERYGDW